MEDTLFLNADLDFKKVLRLRKALNDGTYHVSALKFADCLLCNNPLDQSAQSVPGLPDRGLIN